MSGELGDELGESWRCGDGDFDFDLEADFEWRCDPPELDAEAKVEAGRDFVSYVGFGAAGGGNRCVEAG